MAVRVADSAREEKRDSLRSSGSSANRLLATWAAELEGRGVLVNTVNPGGTQTRARAEAFPNEDPATLKSPEAVGQAFVELALTEKTGCAFDLGHSGNLVTS